MWLSIRDIKMVGGGKKRLEYGAPPNYCNVSGNDDSYNTNYSLARI